MGCFIAQLLTIYSYLIFARIIMSWFPVNPNGPMATIFSALYSVTEPVLGPVRRMMPRMGMFDFSPIIVFFGIMIVSGIIC
ncbi:MAG TPA: YggT family protein [Acidimicrobiales bacterium]|nr:YggT family protein [Acidimicrobiales bacterium]